MSTIANKRGSLSDVRAWARQNGFSVSDRGALPADAMEAYRKALRAWAVKRDLAGTRGVIAQEVVEQFNQETVRNVKPNKSNSPKVKAKSGNGITAVKLAETRRPTAAEIRAAARAAGRDVSDRGRIPTSIMREFVSGKI